MLGHHDHLGRVVFVDRRKALLAKELLPTFDGRDDNAYGMSRRSSNLKRELLLTKLRTKEAVNVSCFWLERTAHMRADP
jgi:hypothetical protein